MTRSALSFAVGMLLLGPTSMACQQDTARPTNDRLRAVSRADSVQAITRYARSLGEAGFMSAVGASDEQRLRVCWVKPCRYGPRAVIQPRARLTDSGSTTLAVGAVIARIINFSDTGYIYDIRGIDTSYKFNLHARDTVYWWVGKKNDKLVSVFFSTKPGARPLESDLDPEPHGAGYWRQPLARWLWDEDDEQAWGTCDGSVCCRSRGTRIEVR